MRLVDSHCHLDFEPLKNEQGSVIEQAHKAGVAKMINIGSSLRGSRASIEIANKYPHIWASVGLHPHDAETVNNIDSVIDELQKLAQNDKVVAIGEIGLDYFELENESQREEQKVLFEAQLDLAQKASLPVIIHTRDAEEDTFNILKAKTLNLKSAPGVVHCFTYRPDLAKKFLDLGFYIGFTGFVTFEQPKFDHIRDSAKIVPMEKLLIETDAPFLAPEPYRGKTNEPAYVIEVAKKISELKNLQLSEVAQKTSANAEKLFKID